MGERPQWQRGEVVSSQRPDLSRSGQGTSNCPCPERHRGKSGRSELNHWQLTHRGLSPIQLQLSRIQDVLCDSVLLRDIPALRLHHELELVRLEQRIVAELEREIRRLLQLLGKIRLLH